MATVSASLAARESKAPSSSAGRRTVLLYFPPAIAGTSASFTNGDAIATRLRSADSACCRDANLHYEVLSDLKLLTTMLISSSGLVVDAFITDQPTLIKQVKGSTNGDRAFIVLLDRASSAHAQTRFNACSEGAAMVTSDIIEVSRMLHVIATQRNSVTKGDGYACPFCGMTGFTEDELCIHGPMYHINHRNISAKCPICNTVAAPMQVHLVNAHGPAGRGERHSEYRDKSIAMHAFALIVVRRPSDGRYLLVQEFASSGYWLPGGAVDASEDPRQAAVREAKEETGIDIRLTGVLQVCFNPSSRSCRVRLIFMAEPIDNNQLPKTFPDYESAGACWVRPGELATLRPLRGTEPLQWFPYVEAGGTVHPLSILDDEGANPPPLPPNAVPLTIPPHGSVGPTTAATVAAALPPVQGPVRPASAAKK